MGASMSQDKMFDNNRLLEVYGKIEGLVPPWLQGSRVSVETSDALVVDMRIVLGVKGSCFGLGVFSLRVGDIGIKLHRLESQAARDHVFI